MYTVEHDIAIDYGCVRACVRACVCACVRACLNSLDVWTTRLMAGTGYCLNHTPNGHGYPLIRTIWYSILLREGVSMGDVLTVLQQLFLKAQTADMSPNNNSLYIPGGENG